MQSGSAAVSPSPGPADAPAEPPPRIDALVLEDATPEDEMRGAELPGAAAAETAATSERPTLAKSRWLAAQRGTPASRSSLGGIQAKVVAFNAFLAAVEDDTKAFVHDSHRQQFSLRYLSPELEQQYVDWRLTRLLPQLKSGLVTLIGLCLAFLLYDYLDQVPNRGGMVLCRLGIAMAMSAYLWTAVILRRHVRGATAVATGAVLLGELALVALEVGGPYEFALCLVYVFTWVGLPWLVATALSGAAVLLWLPAAMISGAYDGTGDDGDNEDDMVRVFGFYAILTASQAFAAYRAESMLRSDFEFESHIAIERQKSRTLLLSVFPNPVVKRLTAKGPGELIADNIEFCTILFSDICGFTAIAARHSAIDVVHIVHRMFQRFDRLCDAQGIYKIETIGDGYMCTSGAPTLDMDHSLKAFCMGVAMIGSLGGDPIRAPDGTQITIRVGLHSGSVHGGVVGERMPRYTLIGDTVNTASRMESTGSAMCVHFSAETHRALSEYVTGSREARTASPEQLQVLRDAFPKIQMHEMDVKGKGRQVTYTFNPGFAPTSDTVGLVTEVKRRRSKVSPEYLASVS